MTNQDETEFGDVETLAPSPHVGAGWAGVTWVPEDKREERGSVVGEGESGRLEAGLAEGDVTTSVSKSWGARLRGVSFGICVLLGAVLGLLGAAGFRSEVSRTPVTASEQKASSQATWEESFAEAPSSAPSVSTLVEARAPAARSEVPTPEAKESSRSSGRGEVRDAVRALLEGRCPAAEALLLRLADEGEVGAFARVARRACAKGTKDSGDVP